MWKVQAPKDTTFFCFSETLKLMAGTYLVSMEPWERKSYQCNDAKTPLFTGLGSVIFNRQWEDVGMFVGAIGKQATPPLFSSRTENLLADLDIA